MTTHPQLEALARECAEAIHQKEGTPFDPQTAAWILADIFKGAALLMRESGVVGALEVTLRGLNSGSVRSKPIMDTSDPEATEYKVQSLDEIIMPALAAARKIEAGEPVAQVPSEDTKRLDWLEANVGRIEAMKPHEPAQVWKWFIFEKQKDSELSMNNLRAAIDSARGRGEG